MRFIDLSKWEWGVRESEGAEAEEFCAQILSAGALCSVSGGRIWAVVPHFAEKLWLQLTGFSARQFVDTLDDQRLLEAVEQGVAWRVAQQSPSLMRVGWGLFVDGSGSQWQYDAVRCGSRLFSGWAQCRTSDWTRVTLDGLLDGPVDGGGGVACVIAGPATLGVCVGIAECSPHEADSTRAHWKHRFMLDAKPSLFLGKIMVNHHLHLAPLDFIFVKRIGFSGSVIAAPRSSVTEAMLFSCQLSNRRPASVRGARSEIRRRDGKRRNRLVAPDALSVASSSILLAGEDDAEIDLGSVAVEMGHGLDEQADQTTSAMESELSNSIWNEICQVGGRLKNRLDPVGVRDLLLGVYHPVDGAMQELKPADVRSLEQSWSPSPISDDFEESPPHSLGLRRKRLRQSTVKPEELMGAPLPEEVLTHLTNQWIWPVSRGLLWPESGVESSPIFAQQELPSGMEHWIDESSQSVSLPRVCFLDSPKIKAKWVGGQGMPVVEFDMSQLYLWESIGLAPIVPPKDCSFAVLTARRLCSGAASVFANLSSIWQSHSLGKHSMMEVVEVQLSQNIAKSFAAALDQLLTSPSDDFLIVYLVWPTEGSIELLRSLLTSVLDESIVVQVVPEAFLLRPSEWTPKALQLWALSTFSLVHVYSQEGVSFEPAFLRSHPLISGPVANQYSLHVSFAVDETQSMVAIAATDATGEIWACKRRSFKGNDHLAQILQDFAKMHQIQVPGVDWEVIFWNCSCSFLFQSQPGMLVASARRTALFQNSWVREKETNSKRSIHSLCDDTHILLFSNHALLVQNCPIRHAELVVLMMTETGLPNHFQCVLDLNKVP